MTQHAYETTAPKPQQFVYYLADANGIPLYVGRSANVALRIRQHNRHASHPENPVFNDKGDWFFDVRSVSMVGPMSWAQALAFERQQIEAIQPRGNVRLTRRDPWPARNRVSA